MGVKVGEQKLASGEITFHIDTYHKDYGSFPQKTGVEANPSAVSGAARSGRGQ